MVLSDVRVERKRRHWSQLRLAFEAGLSLPTVVQAEASRNVSVETAVRLAGAFARTPAIDERAPELEAAQA